MSAVRHDTREDARQDDDARLMEQVALGAPEALEALYDRYARIVLSFAARMLNDREAAEELMQEVFVRVWRQAGTYAPERGAFVTWLLSITHNMAIDDLRKRQRRPQRVDNADPVNLLANVSDTGLPVEARAELGMLRDVLREAIATLPESQRVAIELAYFRGLTQREVADALGEPLGTIKTRMRLGMRKLREYLEDHEVKLA